MASQGINRNARGAEAGTVLWERAARAPGKAAGEM